MSFRAKAAMAVLFVVAAAASSQSRAGIMIGDQIKLSDGVGFPAGIFEIDILNRPVEPNFKTFCVELTETIDFTHTFIVNNISTTTVADGKSLTSYAAWLYDRFRRGTLASFNPLSDTDVNTLQLAIWKAIGYVQADVALHIGPGWYNTYNTVLGTKPWAANFNTDVVNNAWSGIGSVRVVNLKTTLNTNAQDQLAIIPEPYSALVWTLLIICMCGMRPSKEAEV
jgi:hypothetical protein